MSNSLVFCGVLLPITTYSIDEQTLDTIDQYLIDSELPYKDLVAGSERTIRWFTPQQKTPYSVIYLHGFSASRQEISPVTERLAEQLQANIYYVRLRGHGRSEDAMTEGSIKDWFEDTKQAYQIARLLGNKVIVVSTSTGGTLASWLLTQPFAKNIVANIMVSPNFGVKRKSTEIIRWSWGLQIAKWINGGDYYSFTPISPAHRKYWTERYPLKAIVPVIKLVDQVNAIDKSQIRVPQLIIYSPDDQVVDVNAIDDVVSQHTHSKIKLVPFTESHDPAQHVLAGDACSPQSTDAMVKLVHDYIKNLDQ